jgi:hypothetical protein
MACEPCLGVKRARNKTWRAKQERRGRCSCCTQPREPGSTLCARHLAAVRARLRSTGRPVGRPRDARCDVYVARFLAGESVAAIALSMERTPATVRDALVRRGVVARVSRAA